jgi:ankyrin repeat protein
MTTIAQLTEAKILYNINSLLTDTSPLAIVNLNKMFQELIEIYTNLKTIELLLIDYRIDPGANENRAIKFACGNGHLELAKLLLKDSRVNPNVASSINPRAYPIVLAIDNGHQEIVKLLVTNPRVDLTVDNNYPIRGSSSRGYTEVVKLLLENPTVDPGSINSIALRLAIESGRTEVVKLLVENPKIDPSVLDERALLYYLKWGKKESIKVVLPKMNLSKITDLELLKLAKEGSIINELNKLTHDLAIIEIIKSMNNFSIFKIESNKKSLVIGQNNLLNESDNQILLRHSIIKQIVFLMNKFNIAKIKLTDDAIQFVYCKI